MTNLHSSTFRESVTANLDHVYLDYQSHYSTNVIKLLSEFYYSQSTHCRELDLTNHRTKSAILSNKQTRQESRLTWVDLNLKNGVY